MNYKWARPEIHRTFLLEEMKEGNFMEEIGIDGMIMLNIS
jgi:hypothetical protein